MEDTILQRFRRFKETFISSTLPNNELLDMVESFITSKDEELPAEEIPILSGQLSLLDVA